MNKFDITKLISKTSVSGGSLTQEIIKLAMLIAANCLAYKIEDIVKTIMDDKNNGEFHYKEEN